MTWSGILILVCWALSIVLFNTGCSGGGRVYLGYENVDSMQKTENAVERQRWYCDFINCGEEKHGS